MVFAIGIFLILVGSLVILLSIKKSIFSDAIAKTLVAQGKIKEADYVQDQKMTILGYSLFSLIVAVGVYLVK